MLQVNTLFGTSPFVTIQRAFYDIEKIFSFSDLAALTTLKLPNQKIRHYPGIWSADQILSTRKISNRKLKTRKKSQPKQTDCVVMQSDNLAY